MLARGCGLKKRKRNYFQPWVCDVIDSKVSWILQINSSRVGLTACGAYCVNNPNISRLVATVAQLNRTRTLIISHHEISRCFYKKMWEMTQQDCISHEDQSYFTNMLNLSLVPTVGNWRGRWHTHSLWLIRIISLPFLGGMSWRAHHLKSLWQVTGTLRRFLGSLCMSV